MKIQRWKIYYKSKGKECTEIVMKSEDELKKYMWILENIKKVKEIDVEILKEQITQFELF